MGGAGAGQEMAGLPGDCSRPAHPCSRTADRLDLRRVAREQSAWVRSVVLAEAA